MARRTFMFNYWNHGGKSGRVQYVRQRTCTFNTVVSARISYICSECGSKIHNLVPHLVNTDSSARLHRNCGKEVD